MLLVIQCLPVIFAAILVSPCSCFPVIGRGNPKHGIVFPLQHAGRRPTTVSEYVRECVPTPLVETRQAPADKVLSRRRSLFRTFGSLASAVFTIATMGSPSMAFQTYSHNNNNHNLRMMMMGQALLLDQSTLIVTRGHWSIEGASRLPLKLHSCPPLVSGWWSMKCIDIRQNSRSETKKQRTNTKSYAP